MKSNRVGKDKNYRAIKWNKLLLTSNNNNFRKLVKLDNHTKAKYYFEWKKEIQKEYFNTFPSFNREFFKKDMKMFLFIQKMHKMQI